MRPRELSLAELYTYFYYTLPSLQDSCSYQATKEAGHAVTGDGYFSGLFTMWTGSKWNKYDQIAKQLYLSKILGTPYFASSQYNELQDLLNEAEKKGDNIKLFISVVDDFELYDIKVSPLWDLWKTKGIRHYHLIMKDNLANASEKDIMHALLIMHECVLAGGAVVVHCKAGRGRSAFLELLYIMLFGTPDKQMLPGKSLEEVEAYLRSKRSQVDLTDIQRKTANSLYLKFKDIILTNTSSNILDKEELEKNLLKVPTSQHLSLSLDNLKKFLCSVELKNILIDCVYFKKLKAYMIQNDPPARDGFRSGCIKNFFNAIYNQTFPNWYLELTSNQGYLLSLVNADPYAATLNTTKEEDKRIRTDLRDGFLNELNTCLQAVFNCSELQLNDAVKTLEIPQIDFEWTPSENRLT